MIAHQYIIREQKRNSEKLDFDPEECSLNNSSIRLIDKSEAKRIIVEYEWLKTMPLVSKYHFGIFFNINGKEYLGGVLVYSPDYAENTGVWKKYNFEDKLILLSRGVCLWWTPKNCASYFISRSIQWLKKNTKYRIVTATVDPMAGEIGTIYQSLNWYYVGLMAGNYSSNKETKRFSVLINGKLRYSRSIRKELGTMKREEILKKYPDAKFINQYRKRRYFYFFDTKQKNQVYYDSIKHLILPYPKRDLNPISGIIYMIKNRINNKIYIGQTVRSLNDRIDDYQKGLGNNYLNNSFKKYGFENFEFSIIDTATSIDELNSKEIHWINKYNTTDKNKGYNLEDGGRNSLLSQETREKMSEARKGKKQTTDWVKKRIAKAGSEEAKKYGRAKTEEERKWLSETTPKYWLGKTRDEETRKKISQTKKERGFSEKQKEVWCKRVIAYDPKTNEVINTYESSTEAAKCLGNISQSTISRRCSGVTKNKGSIYFKYEEK